jgi:uncharacterized Zn finger protein
MNQANLNVDFNQTVPVICEKCSSPYFKQTLVIRKVPGILVGQKEHSFVPIPVFSCDSCGHVNEEFRPKQGTQLD